MIFLSPIAKPGQLVMMLQEEIIFEDYFRCYCLGGKYVRIMQYEPRNPHHLRYQSNNGPASRKIIEDRYMITYWIFAMHWDMILIPWKWQCAMAFRTLLISVIQLRMQISIPLVRIILNG